MLRWLALGLLLLPGAEACAQSGTAKLELEFEKNEDCARLTPEGCPALPEADLPLVLDGTFVWSWDVDPACSAFVPSPAPIHVSFQGQVHDYAGWLAVEAEPKELFIPVEDQYDFTDDAVDPANARFQGREEYPLRVVISLVGEPSADGMTRLDNADGVVQLFLRASSNATSAFMAGYAIEQFFLDGGPVLDEANQANDREASMPSVLLVVAAVAIAAVLRRRV